MLDFVQESPTIQRILVILKGMSEEDLQDILYRVGGKKRLRDLEMELKEIGSAIKRPES